MKYPLEISTPPAEDPITLSEAKDLFREDRNVEDNLIYQFINAAQKSLERHTGYHLVDTVFKMYLDNFEDVKIPKKPFKSGSLSIEYVDEAGATQTLSASLYEVHEQESPVSVEFFSGLPKLSDADGDKYPVIITFTCGYGTGADVPYDWKSIVGLVAMTYWERNVKSENPLSYGVVKSLLQDYRIGRFK